MTITSNHSKGRHLAAVADLDEARAPVRAASQTVADTFRLGVASAVGTPLSGPVPAAVLDYLDGLDADHATACDVLDRAAADVEAAREELSEAARRLADAEERWARAGIVADETTQAVIAAREAAGVNVVSDWVSVAAVTVERDRYRLLTTLAVLLVAAIAAVASYMHVASLAIRFGQPAVAADLLPISIDGLVTVASLVMLRSARLGVSAPWLARTGLGLAVLATLACNVAYGLPHRWPGALLSGWPAVSFVVAAEMAIAMTRRRAAKPATSALDKPATVAKGGQRPRSQTAPKVARASVADMDAAALAVLANSPGLTHKQLAAAIGTSERTARRVRARLNGAAT